MSTDKTGGPAFARPASPAHEYGFHKHQDGMTLRDYFASKAMLAYMTHERGAVQPNEVIAEGAYAVADAMLKARAA